MYIPGRFVPSGLTKTIHYDEEGRMREFRKDSKDEAGLGEANSLYATDAEMFGSRAPFLKVNNIRDARRRNYIIQAGGACIYWEVDPMLAEPYDHNRVQYTAPDSRDSFGHNSMDGLPSRMASNVGRK